MRQAAVFVAALLTLTGCATVAPAPSSGTAAIPLWKNFADKPKGYLPPQAVGAEAYLAPPPAADSTRDRADMEIFAATRALKGSPRWTQAQSDADAESPSAPKAFDCALGTSLDVAVQPILIRMLLRASTDSDNLSRTAKTTFARKRPFLRAEGDICIAREQWLIDQASYPSGHAATGWLWGLILSELAPDRAAPLMSRARAFGESRVVCGVHYASDVEAGRDVAAASLARLRADPAFMADLAVARRELAAARASASAPASCGVRDTLDRPVY